MVLVEASPHLGPLVSLQVQVLDEVALRRTMTKTTMVGSLDVAKVSY